VKDNRQAGILFIMISAVIYGFTPVLAASSYRYGNNGINMAFFRALIPLPVLIGIVLGVNHKAKVSSGQILLGIVAGFLSFGYVLLLYSSYEYISVGMATVLHFLYPLYVVLFEALFRRKRLRHMQAVGLTLCFIGVLFSVEPGGNGKLNWTGILLAIGSGIVYAAYIILLEQESKRPLPVYLLMMIISLTGVVLCGTVGMIAGRITFSLPTAAWTYLVPCVLLVSLVACILFQLGTRNIGGTDAAIYSLLEPVTSIVFGCLLMGDTVRVSNTIGSTLILSGLFCNALAERQGSGRIKH